MVVPRMVERAKVVAIAERPDSFLMVQNQSVTGLQDRSYRLNRTNVKLQGFVHGIKPSYIFGNL